MHAITNENLRTQILQLKPDATALSQLFDRSGVDEFHFVTRLVKIFAFILVFMAMGPFTGWDPLTNSASNGVTARPVARDRDTRVEDAILALC
jgi:hypothetical protein